MGKFSEDKYDVYYKLAKEQGWRTSSAFKLLQIDEEFHIFEGVKKAVDLCAAPGSWSQVLEKNLRDEDAKIIAVDMKAMIPIPRVIQVRGDITEERTAHEIISHFGGEQVDLVVCDGAPAATTGLNDMDEYFQDQCLLDALNITIHILKKGGVFISKIFRGRDVSLLYHKLRLFFPQVTLGKPRCCSNFSKEAFAVCQYYSPPPGYIPSMETRLSTNSLIDKSSLEEINNVIIPFVACGDLNCLDPDAYYGS